MRSPQLLLEALGQSDYDVLLIDLNYTRDTTSGKEGLDLLARLQEIDPRLPVIVMTAWGNIDLAVESIKRGARDFIQKPWENERLISLIRVHAELHQALRRARQLELENRLLRAEGMPEFVAGAPLDAAGARTHRPGGPVGCQCAHHRRTRHRQGDRRQAAARRIAAQRAWRWWPSMPAVCRKARSKAKSSATSKARLLTLAPTASAASNWPTAARSSSTKSPTCRFASRPSCCACSRPANWSASAHRKRGASTCAFSRLPTRTCPRNPKAEIFAKTCSSASTRSRFICPLCATAAKTFRCWRRTF